MKFKCQRGAQIVEFAFVLPILLVIIFLIIDFGFLVYNQAIITNASREAARAGTVLTATPWTTAAVQTVACNYARNALISTQSGTYPTTCTAATNPAVQIINLNGNVPPLFNDPIRVQVTYVYSGFLTSTNPWLGVSPWSLTAGTTMNHE
jgi:Flp pilus assembly protein TadG